MDNLERFLSESTWSQNTLERYRRAVVQFLAECGDPAVLDASGLRTWLDSHGWGSSSKWVAFNGVRAYLRWMYGANHAALTLRIRRDEAPPQRSLRLEQVRVLLASFDTSSPKGRRDLAMTGVFLDSGLRASEVCRLGLKYLALAEQSLQVQVKGGKWNRRVFSHYTATWLVSWLADREHIAAPGVGEVFVSIGGNLPGHTLTRHGLLCVVRTWGLKAGIGALSPHDLRRTMGSVSTVLGAPEDIAMKGGGWHDAKVFRRYTVGVLVDDMRPYFPTTGAMDR